MINDVFRCPHACIDTAMIMEAKNQCAAWADFLHTGCSRGFSEKKSGICLLAVAWLLSITSATNASTLYRLDVIRSGDSYHAVADAYLAAKPAAVCAALVDFAHLPQISPDVRKAVVIRRIGARSEVVYLESRFCIGAFCRTLRQVEQFTQLTSHDILAVTLPKGSNIKQGASSWHVEPDGAGTTLHWDMTLEPDFWVPPFIGPSLVRMEIRVDGEKFVRGLEQYAKKNPIAS